MPDWLTDINKLGSISSIIGLGFTFFLFMEARWIRKSFIRRARLPELNKELRRTTSDLSENLKVWSNDKNRAIQSFSKVKALLENIKPKLPIDERKKVVAYLSKLQQRRLFFIKKSMADLSEDSAWKLYTELSGLVTSLEQLAKDSKWD